MPFEKEFVSLKGRLLSRHLGRKVSFRWMAPPSYPEAPSYSVLLMNDGQDFTGMGLEKILSAAFARPGLKPFIYVGIEADANRIQEYGIKGAPDYKGRGGRAGRYSDFVTSELIPFLRQEFRTAEAPGDWVFCGMSLGGLSAFDIVFNHPALFGGAAVFSGSFWWRKKAYVKGDLKDRSRMVLEKIRQGRHSPHLRFWLQCGTEDETADRNNNGLIDSIEDTLDVIRELKHIGYTYPGNITYLQLEGGKHDLPTWGGVFPEFLVWAFGEPSSPENS